MTMNKRSAIVPRTGLLLIMLMTFLLTLAGCADSETVVHQKSVMVLNEKAQIMIQAGDAAGAVCRLESALDLIPNESHTLNNLAVAYTQTQQFEKAIALYQQLEKAGDASIPNLPLALGTAYEQWGDKVMMESDAAAEKPDQKSKSDTLKQQALQAYNQAVESYQKIDKPDAQMQAQVEMLKQHIQAVKSGKSSHQPEQ